MPDLESSIARWREQMLAAGLQPAPLEELESHLREELEELIRFGMDAQKAFALAVIRIGSANELRHEFKKTGGATPSTRKKAVRFFSGIMVVYLLSLTILLFKQALTPGERLLGLDALAATAVLMWTLIRVLPRYFPIIRHERAQSIVGLAGGISGMGWFCAFVFLILPRCHFTESQLLIAILWALVPVQALPTATFLILDKSENPPLAPALTV